MTMTTIDRPFRFPLICTENVVFSGLFLMLLMMRLFLRSPLLELDEAEQVVMAQSLHVGYANQPPLYSWLQYLVFQLMGVSLFSVALLKSLLLTGCAWLYFKISRLHCATPTHALCAALSWALIPAISLDLIKDNTHSVMALLMACMTWYVFVGCRHLGRVKRCVLFAGVIGGGFLSKFNYFLFLLPLLFCYWRLITPKERRVLVISLLLAVVIASPYWYWLLNHAEIGLHAASKLVPQNKTHWRGLINLMKSLIFFLAPLISLFFFFPISPFRQSKSIANRLLDHYHFAALLFLFLVAIIAGFRDFETRWLIPVFFLAPLLVFSRVTSDEYTKYRQTPFIIFCLLVQCVYMGTLIYRSHHGHQRQPVLIEAINRQIPANADWLISESFWLLGNLRLQNPQIKIKAVTATTPLPTGKLVLLWLADTPPFWIVPLEQITQNPAELFRDQENGKVVAGLLAYEHSRIK